MTHFTYTAEKAGGETYTGATEANDRFAVYEIVRQEGGHLLSIQEENMNSFWSVAHWNMLLARVKEYDKILFARNLGAMLSAGLSLSRALAVSERQTKNIKLASITNRIATDVRRGETLHDALARHPKTFPKLFVAMVRAGEEGGDLSGALEALADQMERMYNLKKKIQGAMIYPGIILIAIGGIGFFMMTQVVPTLASTFAQMKVDLPLSTQIIIAMSTFLARYTLLAGLLAVVVIAGVYAAFKTEPVRRAFDWALIRVPLIGEITKEVNAARTARTLASLLASGVDVLTALEITGEVVQNSFFKEVIANAAKGVGSGEALSISFTKREDLYPAFVGEMMSVGEETGETNEMLKRLALYYETEVDRKTKDMSTVIEPLLMLVIGGAVGFFAVSMISPIYSLSSSIG